LFASGGLIEFIHIVTLRHNKSFPTMYQW